MRQQLGSLHEAALEQCGLAAPLVARVWAHDPSLWPGAVEARTRLLWLEAVDRTRARAGDLQTLADEVVADGITDVLVLGMGGVVLSTSALAALVDQPRVRLHLLDSTHPDAVARVRAAMDPDTWLVLVASKSGATLGTRTLFDRFHADLVAALGTERAGRHLIMLTDPESPLVDIAEAVGARAVVATNHGLSGRWSTLDVLALFPAALLGINLPSYLDGSTIAFDHARSADLGVNTPARLGAILAAAALAGRCHLVLVLSEPLQGFGRWLAHLIGGSLGKDGRGVVPIVTTHLDEPAQYGTDVFVVAFGDRLGLQAIADHGLPTVALDEPTLATLAGEVLRWEFATAVAAALLGVNPFDAPAAAATAAATRRLLARDVEPLATMAASDLLRVVDEVDRLVLSAWVDPDGATAGRVHDAGAVLRRRFGIPVLVEICPRALHVTGQLHNDGPPGGLHVVVFDPPLALVPRPGGGGDFDQLIRAQLAASLEVLRAHGRRVGLVTLEDLLDT